MCASLRQLGDLPRIPENIDENIATPVVVEGDVHVWRISLARRTQTRKRLTLLLSAVEQARAARFRFEQHRKRFVVAHGGLRIVLSSYLDRPPERLSFSAGADGKPFLERQPGDVDLRFNLSHSADLALLAVAVGREVGVDVERLNARVETGKLAARFFAPEERVALERAPLDRRLAEFFRIWTLKEAYLKAVGTGLGRSLSSFAVSPSGNQLPHLLRSDVGDAEDWRLRCLDTAPEDGQAFAGALVTSRI